MTIKYAKQLPTSQTAIVYSKLAIEKLDQDAKYVQS